MKGRRLFVGRDDDGSQAYAVFMSEEEQDKIKKALERVIFFAGGMSPVMDDISLLEQLEKEL